MTNTQTTKTKTNHYFRAVLTALAMLAAMLAALLVAGGTALAATAALGNSSPIQLVDNSPANPYPSQINVQNLSGTISDLNLNGYSHDFPDDVAVLLVGPKGQKALLMSDVGGGDLANAIADVNLTLDDEATTSLPDDLPRLEQMASGTYKPTQGTITTSGSDDCPVPANLRK